MWVAAAAAAPGQGRCSLRGRVSPGARWVEVGRGHLPAEPLRAREQHASGAGGGEDQGRVRRGQGASRPRRPVPFACVRSRKCLFRTLEDA